jgi:hypothetical protein
VSQSVRKERRERAVKTEEASREKKVQGKKKASKETNEEKRKVKEEELKEEALNLHRQLKAHGLAMFDGVAVDFHRRRPAVVFDPKTETLSTVALEDLPRYMSSKGYEEFSSTQCFQKGRRS